METNDTKVEKKKGTWPESGIIYCEKENCWCGNVNTGNGSCMAVRCPIHDAKYIREQEKRKERLQHLYRKEMNRKEQEKTAPPAPIRRQTRTKQELLQEQIARKKRQVARYYKMAKPRRAIQIDLEVHRLERELKESI